MFPEFQYLEDEIDTGPPAPELPPDEPAYQTFVRFGELLMRKRALAREMQEVDKEIGRLTPPLLAYFEAHPAQPRVCVHDLTIFPRDDMYIRRKKNFTLQEACDALRSGGWGHFVYDNFSTGAISKHIRELEEDHAEEFEGGTVNDLAELLPPPIASVLDLNPAPKIVGLRSNKSKPRTKKY